MRTVITEQAAALFPAVLALGFLIKYDFLALMIYQVPTVGGLIGKNIVWIPVIHLLRQLMDYLRNIMLERREDVQ